MAARGGIVAFNVTDAAGAVVPFDDVVARAGLSRVSVRGGCFCNPGCAEAALALDAERARTCRSTQAGRFTPARFAACMGGPIGAVRASVGVATSAADIDRLLVVLESYRNPAS
jgi:selenocysteine lyase/cysteine desulfurase